jgi:hypothetical protein
MKTSKTAPPSRRAINASKTSLQARKKVREFFDQYTPSEAVDILLSACRAAESNYIWNYHNPSDLIHFIQAVKNILMVVFKSTEKELQFLAKEVEDDKFEYPFKTKFLTPEEIADPAFTLFKYSRVNRLTDLKSKLDLILEFALSKNSIVASGNNLAVLTTAELLTKFIESAAMLTYPNLA